MDLILTSSNLNRDLTPMENSKASLVNPSYMKGMRVGLILLIIALSSGLGYNIHGIALMYDHFINVPPHIARV